MTFRYSTPHTLGRQDTAAMHIHTRFRTAAVIGIALFLTACGKPETISGESPDPDDAALNAAKPVELPPMSCVNAENSPKCFPIFTPAAKSAANWMKL